MVFNILLYYIQWLSKGGVVATKATAMKYLVEWNLAGLCPNSIYTIYVQIMFGWL